MYSLLTTLDKVVNDTIVHRGEFLDIVVRRMNLNKTKLAEKAGYDRTTYYFHIKQPNLDFRILKAYGDKMPYNFAKDFPEMLNEFPETYFPIDTFEGMRKDRDFWRDEYGRVLKENKVLREEIEVLKAEIKSLSSKRK